MNLGCEQGKNTRKRRKFQDFWSFEPQSVFICARLWLTLACCLRSARFSAAPALPFKLLPFRLRRSRAITCDSGDT